MLLKNKVIAFPALAEPQAIGDGEPAYGGRLIIKPDDADVKAIDAALLAVATAKWKDDGAAVLALLTEEKRVAFEKSAYRNKKTTKVYDGFEGSYSLGTRNPKAQPSVFDQYNKEVVGKSPIERLIYSGAKVHAKVEFWAQDNSFGRRINCSLLGVMFAGDGERFGGGSAPASKDDFSDLASAGDPEGVL